jgi:Tol biopolymer transport system component
MGESGYDCAMSRLSNLLDKLRERRKTTSPSPPRPLVLGPRQVRLIVVLFIANALILLLMASLLFQALTGQPLTVVVRQMVTPAPQLPTRAPLPTPPAAPTPAPTPFGGGGTVAFVLRREGTSNIYAVNLGDKRLVRLTWTTDGDRDPTFSPDGKELAFASHRDGSWGIYRIELDTGVTTRLTFTSSFSAGPTWSPDNKWIAFESYRGGNMDIYVMDRDGKNVSRLTTDPAPDFSPAWSLDGRYIAFASYRTGNKDIFLHSLDTGEEINLTNNPDRDEDNPAWSHDGTKLAYTSSHLGDSAIYVNTFDWKQRPTDEAQVELFGQGTSPAWSPDDSGLGFVYNRDSQDVLIAASLGGWGLAQQALGGREFIEHPTWSSVLIPEATINRVAEQAPPKAPPLYSELISSPLTSTPPFTLVVLPDYGNQRFLMSDAVDDSFKALRARVKVETGYDYLSELADTWRPMDHTPRPGQSHRSWHVSGRAFDLNPSYTQDFSHTMEIVREDIGYTTYWRVYLKAMKQDGTQGEPLKEAPWLMVTGGDASAEGGRLKAIPSGYYFDLTTLAADYGWNRVQAIYRWRYFFPDAEYWHFQKDTGLSWWEAMEQVYTESDIVGFYGPYPGRD